MLKPLRPKKIKIKILIILTGRFLTDAQICLLVMALIVFFNAIQDKTDESQLSVAEKGKLDSMDAWYATVDANNDPDNFDPCAVTALPEGWSTAAENFAT